MMRMLRLALLVCALPALGCEARISFGARCAAGAECPPELGCLAGRCRATCAQSGDCEAPFVCLFDEAGRGACTVPEDRSCEGGCVEPLVCLGGECVQPCDDPSPCAPGLGCVDGHCARVATEPCDVLTGEGCETGRRCELDALPAPSCRAITVASDRMLALHAPCTGTEACEAGLTCVAGRCTRYCLLGATEALSSCGHGSRCARYDEAGAPAPTDALGYCTQPCDPVGQTGCTVAEHVCVLSYDSRVSVGSCRYGRDTACAGAGDVGDPGCALGGTAEGCDVAMAAVHFLRGRGAAGMIEELCIPLCDDDEDCDAGFRCHTTSAALDIETTGGERRRIGGCLPACEDGACPAFATTLGLACEPRGRFCTSGCDTLEDCYPGFTCESGRCTPPPA